MQIALSDPPERLLQQLSTQQLRCFVAVATTLHFGQAATQLYLSPSALSRQILRLETMLGASLLHRSTRQVMLTPKGTEFLPHARELLESLDRCIEHVRSLDTSGDEVWLEHPPYMSGSVDALLRTIHEHNPDMTIYCLERTEDVRHARTEAAQMGLSHHSAPDPRSASVDFGVEPMHLIVSRDDPLAQVGLITAESLAGRDVLVAAECYSRAERQALTDLLLDVASVEFAPMPIDEDSWARLLATGLPLVVPAADDPAVTTGLQLVAVSEELCPHVALWWDPHYETMMASVAEVARQHRQASHGPAADLTTATSGTS